MHGTFSQVGINHPITSIIEVSSSKSPPSTPPPAALFPSIPPFLRMPRPFPPLSCSPSFFLSFFASSFLISRLVIDKGPKWKVFGKPGQYWNVRDLFLPLNTTLSDICLRLPRKTTCAACPSSSLLPCACHGKQHVQPAHRHPCCRARHKFRYLPHCLERLHKHQQTKHSDIHSPKINRDIPASTEPSYHPTFHLPTFPPSISPPFTLFFLDRGR